MTRNILQEIRALHQLSATMESSHSIESVLTSAAEAVARLLPCDRVSLIEFDREHRTVGFFARGGPGHSEVVTSVGFSELEQGLSGWVLQHARPALSPKGVSDERESPEVQARRVATHCGSIIVVPMQVAGLTLGTMTAINGLTDRDFDQDDVDLMEMFGNFCAIVIQNARSYLALEQRNVMKDRLFTILAHDLRGPSSNIAMMMDLIAERLHSDPELHHLLSLGAKSAHQTLDLLENVLSWIRTQLDGQQVTTQAFHVRDVFEHVTGWLDPLGSRKGINFEVDCPESLRLTLDRASVETIVRNLLTNAIKYSHPNSTVHVRARETGPDVELEVEDVGQGMTAQQVEKLFGSLKVHSEPGTQGESGSGLGMVFCTDLARSLGGKLEVESALGQGSRFRLRLPKTTSSTTF